MQCKESAMLGDGWLRRLSASHTFSLKLAKRKKNMPWRKEAGCGCCILLRMSARLLSLLEKKLCKEGGNF